MNVTKTPLPQSIGRPVISVLHVRGLRYLEDLARVSEKDIAKLPGIEPKVMGILRQMLRDKGLRFRA